MSSFLLTLLASGTAILGQPVSAQPAPIAPEVRGMIESAIRSGDDQAIEAIVRFAIEAQPGAQQEIQSLYEAYRQSTRPEVAAAPAVAKPRRPEPPPSQHDTRWSGNVELGGMRTTAGENSSLGLFASAKAQSTGLNWVHKLSARAELQESNGDRTVERFMAEWQPRVTMGDSLYGYGLVQLERDPFVGYSSRQSVGLGTGYTIADSEAVRFDVSGGAVLRRTDRIGEPETRSLAGRASADFSWKLAETLELKQSGALYVEEESSNGLATTSLDAAIIGPLRLRMSYEQRFDKDRRRLTSRVGSSSRATILYAF